MSKKTNDRKLRSGASYEDIGIKFNDLFDDVDRLTQLEAQSLDSVLKPRGVQTVLDCACGTGIQAIGLAQLGYRVAASDISRTMVEALKRRAISKGVSIEAKQADFTDLSVWRGKVFDAVINCGHSILYVDTLDEVTQTLKSMQSVAKSGGVLVVGVHNYQKLMREGKYFEYRKSRITNGVPEWVYDLRTFQGNKVTAIHTFTRFINGRLYTKSYPKTSLLVSPDELKDAMESSNLSSVELLDLVTLRPFKDEEWTLLVGYKK